MKIGVSSYSFAKYIEQTHCDYLHICDLAKEMGFQGIEFIELEHPRFQITQSPAETARVIREHCGKIGLEIIAYTVSANLLTEDMAAECARIMGCVDVARELGAGVLRHDAAWAPRAQHGYSWRDAIVEMAPHIREITEYARSLGVKTCTENHGRFFQDPERVEALIRAVDHPNFGWLVDMGNFGGVDADIPAAVLTAAPYAFHLHAKDHLYKPGAEIAPDGWRTSRGGNHFRSTVAGHGVVPIQQCLRIMQEAGYDSYVSLEFEGWEETLPALRSGCAYLKKLV